jgi:hypothetical protein
MFRKILLSLCALASALWFGGTVAQNIVAYDLFVTGTAQLKTLDVTLQMNSFRIVSNISVYCIGAFAIGSFSFLLYCIMQRATFKSRGYLLMCCILTVISIVLVAIPSATDYAIYSSFPDHYALTALPASEVKDLFVKRYTEQSPYSMLSILTAASVALFFVFQPLKYKK